jgi:hypothetical protein
MKKLLICALGLTVLAGCKTTTSTTAPAADDTKQGSVVIEEQSAPQGMNSRDPSTALPLRSVQRWSWIIEGKPELAYDLMSPGYRSTRTRDDYATRMLNRPVKWTKAEYVDHDCSSEEACLVKVKIDFKITMPQVGEVESTDVLLERWVRSDAQWFFLPDENK